MSVVPRGAQRILQQTASADPRYCTTIFGTLEPDAGTGEVAVRLNVMQDFLAQQLRTAQQAGDIDPDVDIHREAVALMAMSPGSD